MMAGLMTSKPTVVTTSEQSQEAVRKTLEIVANYEPSQVVIWYQSPEHGTGVEISEGTERVKTVGALHVAAQELWDA
jgi:hypothetical protein